MFDTFEYQVLEMTKENKETLAFFEEEYMEWNVGPFTIVFLCEQFNNWAFWIYDKSKMDKIIEIQSEDDELLFFEKIKQEIEKDLASKENQLTLF